MPNTSQEDDALDAAIKGDDLRAMGRDIYLAGLHKGRDEAAETIRGMLDSFPRRSGTWSKLVDLITALERADEST